jgi:hypothetical protein
MASVAAAPAVVPATVPPPKPADPIVPAPPTPAAFQETPSPASGREVDLNALWAGILEAVGRASPFTRGYLIEAHPVSLTKNVFTVGFAPEFADHIDLVNNAKTQGVLQTKLSEFGFPNTQVKFIKAEPPSGWAETRASVQPAAPVALAAATAPTPALAPSTAPVKREKPVPIALNAEDFKNDPLIQKALEVFKGRIIEVRA